MILFFLALSFLLYQNIPAFSETITVGDTNVSLSMDGHLQDWPDCRMINLDNADQVVEGKFFWKGPDDFNGRIFITYDQEFLYLAAVVTRNGTPTNANAPAILWNGDCLEVYLSTDPDPADHRRLTRGDYHIGISPGTKCANSQVWCFNQGKAVPGARVKAKNSKKGYVLEAALPLKFFSGLNIGPRQTCGFNVALDEGGAVSGNRLVQMDLSGHANSWQNPSVWNRIEWIGATQVAVPPADEEDENSILVKDGTQGAIFLGVKTLAGVVLDSGGKPLAGAKVSTWPATEPVTTDAAGKFTLAQVKVYRQTVIYGRQDGYYTSLGVPNPASWATTIRLSAMPVSVLDSHHGLNPVFWGANISLAPGGLNLPTDLPVSLVKTLGLGILWLKADGLENRDPAAQKDILDQWVAYAQAIGAEPAVEVPIGPNASDLGTEWAGMAGGKIHYWTLGNEPDRPAPSLSVSFQNYNAYDYINDFREFYNSVKRVDPSLIVLGPNLAFPEAEDAKDWLTPFLRFDGDIVNLVSAAHYAGDSRAQASASNLAEDARVFAPDFQTLQSKVSQNSDIYIPVVISNVGLYPAPVSMSALGAAGSDPVTDFTDALWEAEVAGTLLQAGACMGAFGDLERPDGLGLISKGNLNPAAWVLKIFAGRWKGVPVTAQVLKPLISVYAAQDPQTKDLSLFILNRSHQYYWLNISLNGQSDDLAVDAGLDSHFRFEVPDQAVASLRIKADHSPGDAEIYTAKMAEAEQAPSVQALKP